MIVHELRGFLDATTLTLFDLYAGTCKKDLRFILPSITTMCLTWYALDTDAMQCMHVVPLTTLSVWFRRFAKMAT